MERFTIDTFAEAFEAAVRWQAVATMMSHLDICETKEVCRFCYEARRAYVEAKLYYDTQVWGTDA